MSNDLARLTRVMEIFHEYGAAFPASYVRAFLTIAEKPGRSISEYGDMLDTSQPVISRLLLQLGEKSRAGGKGLGWVQRVADPHDLRIKRLEITPRGQNVVQRIETAMR